ncbi:hypothetical protein CEXT_149651 [Caerostris extrusa]|uniref:Uncharacterized protein n=1 Tax=Caerostris extrusa TaxID=172846 RepID=A0AAV4XSP1_CAEEX|nr:hypothetical protein CEXT_149651 [Caerostris extrusa]
MVGKFNYSTTTSMITQEVRDSLEANENVFVENSPKTNSSVVEVEAATSRKKERNCLIRRSSMVKFCQQMPRDLSSKIKLLCFGSSWEDEGERKLDNSEIRPFHSCFG